MPAYHYQFFQSHSVQNIFELNSKTLTQLYDSEIGVAIHSNQKLMTDKVVFKERQVKQKVSFFCSHLAFSVPLGFANLVLYHAIQYAKGCCAVSASLQISTV